MAEFSTEAALSVVLEESSVRDVRSTLEDRLGGAATVTAPPSQGVGARSDGGMVPARGLGASRSDVQMAQLERLDEIKDEIEKLGVSGGAGGPGGGAGGTALGDVGEAYFQFKTLKTLGGLAGGVSLGSLSLTGGIAIAGGASFALAAGTTMKVIADMFESGAWGSSTVVTDEFIAEELPGVSEEDVLDDEGVEDAERGFNEYLDRQTVEEARRERNYQNRGGRGGAPASTLPSATGNATELEVVSVVPEEGSNDFMVTLEPADGGRPITVRYTRLPSGLQAKADEWLTSDSGSGGGGNGGGSDSGDATSAGSPSAARRDQEVRQELVGALKEAMGDQSMNIDIYNEYYLDPSGMQLIEEEFDKKANEAKKEAVNEIKRLMGANSDSGTGRARY